MQTTNKIVVGDSQQMPELAEECLLLLDRYQTQRWDGLDEKSKGRPLILGPDEVFKE